MFSMNIESFHYLLSDSQSGHVITQFSLYCKDKSITSGQTLSFSYGWTLVIGYN